MKLGLFIPCYIDQLFPRVGIASYELLERLGCEVVFLEDLSCCGQPMDNSGYEQLTRKAGYKQSFLQALHKIDYLVTPSASCSFHLQAHLLRQEQQAHKIMELTSFLHDVIPDRELGAVFPHRVALHQSCHGLRGLGLGKSSELGGADFSKIEKVLEGVAGLDLVLPPHSDECCGFGGSFAVTQKAVSLKMGQDKLHYLAQTAPEFVTATDMSCLMHLQGIFKANKSPIQCIHLIEILNAR